MRTAPKLHRDDPARDALAGNVKVTREDWLRQANAVLIRDGVDAVKIQSLAAGMVVSRSSFYWYFKNRTDLLNALLEAWAARNTAAIEEQAAMPAGSITEAVCHIFACVVDDDLFDTALDFAIRDWARRDAKVRAKLHASDNRRLAALTAMFARHGYADAEAATRARVLYFMQVGYDLAAPEMDLEERLAMIPHYLRVFTGQEPRGPEIAAFTIFARKHWLGGQQRLP